MSKKKGLGKFVFGAAIGAGLGLLFAPKKGSEMRADLKDKLDDFVKQVKNIDKEEVKAQFDEKVEQIREELKDLDKEKALKLAKKKGEEIRKQAEELYELAKEKGTPVLEKAASDVRTKTIEVLNDVVDKLEAAEKGSKKRA
jgi:gas vesicle protein